MAERAESAAIALTRAHETLLGPVGAFLPQRVPVIGGLQEPFAAFAAATRSLTEHYHEPAPGVRIWLDGLFGHCDPDVLDAAAEADEATKSGLLGVLSVLTHTYRWDTIPPAAERFVETSLAVPDGIRLPFAALCDELGVPHVGTTWSFLMCNWRVPGREGDWYDAESLPESDLHLGCEWLRPPALSSLENFHLAFVCLEAKGGRAVSAAVDAVCAAHRDDPVATMDALERLADAIDGLTRQFVDRIRVSRVALDGWLDLVQPTFGWGLPGDDGRPLAGPGGMQLGTVHVLDAVLGIPAGSTIGRATADSRRYIPSRHRAFLHVLDGYAPRLREFASAAAPREVKRAFNAAVRAWRRFRIAHRVQGARYIRAGSESGQPRMSSGTGIGNANAALADVEPADVFEREMLDRVGETTDALVAGAGEPAEVRTPETAFRFLDRAQLRRLLSLAERRLFPTGAAIINAGSRSEAMYLLMEGTASVITSSSGSTIARIWPGELVGELSFLGAVPSTSVVADENVVVDVMNGDAVHTLLEAEVALAAVFYRSLAVLIARRLNSTSAGWAAPQDD